MRKICNFIIKFSIYGLVFLTPLFFLPWTMEVFEFNKQYLLVFLVSLALLAWLGKMVAVSKRLSLRRTPLDIWIGVFMAMVIFSALFSLDKVSSWFGFYGRFSDSTIGLLALGVFYFVVVNNVKLGARRLFLDKILRLFLTSSWLVVLITYLSVLGLWTKIPGLPQIMNSRSFTPIGDSLEGLSIFLAAVIGLVVIMFLSLSDGIEQISQFIRFVRNAIRSGQTKELRRLPKGWLLIIDLIGLSAAVVLLAIIGFWPAWLSLGAVMLLLLVLVIWRQMFSKRVNLLILPIILLLVSGAGLFGLLDKAERLNDQIHLAKEVILDYETTDQITWQTLKEYPFFGSGPGTFSADFNKFKPLEFNQGEFWNTKFNKGASHLTEIIGTTGILGILSYLIVIGIFVSTVVVSLWKLSRDTLFPSKKSIDVLFFSSLFLTWLVFLISQFVYSANTVLVFCFWLFMALTMVVWQGLQPEPCKKISFSFKKRPEVGLIINILLVILTFVFLGLFYLDIQFYLADVKFKQSVPNSRQLVKQLEKAVNLNKYRETYKQGLSQAYLVSAQAEARKPEKERDMRLLQAYAAGAVQQAQSATQISPNLVGPWENLGAIYRDSRGLFDGTLPLALEAFIRALELEPTNLFFYRELCRINLISQGGDWQETISYCQKAIELKPNYLDTHIQLALVYKQKGDLEEAVKQLEGALAKLRGVNFQEDSRLAGAAAEIYFQLGQVYFDLNQISQAIKMFEQAVIIMPQHTNALYALALSYQAKGRLQDALIQFEIVNQLAPGNSEIMARIQQIEQQIEQ